MTCGACCAYFRASFYWAEGNDVEGGTVPAELTDKLNDFMRVMKGTNCPTPRCIALQGTIGERIWCSIYEQRPTPCRQFAMGDERCASARQHHGLPPLPAGDLPLAA